MKIMIKISLSSILKVLIKKLKPRDGLINDYKKHLKTQLAEGYYLILFRYLHHELERNPRTGILQKDKGP